MTSEERTLGLAALTGLGAVLAGSASARIQLAVAASPPLGAGPLERAWAYLILVLTLLTVLASFGSLAQIVFRRPLSLLESRAGRLATPVTHGWLVWVALGAAGALVVAAIAGAASAHDSGYSLITNSPAFADVGVQLTIAASIAMCVSFDVFNRWWRGARSNGQCAACGYSLAGLPEGTACPECGR